MKARINKEQSKDLNATEIGERLISIMNKLQGLGVFYGEGYGGFHEEKYPHSCFFFKMILDRHHGGFQSYMEDGAEGTADLIATATEDTATEELLSLLEGTFNKLKKQ